MPDLTDIRSLLTDEHGLAVVSTAHSDGRVLSSVVNCGVMQHPVAGTECLAFVSRGDAARLGHIRRGRQVTMTIRRGWRWIGCTGPADVIGPDDAAPGFDADRLRVLLRTVFEHAGGSHDDFEEYDRVMLAERRVAVFVHPDRVIGNA
jgi:PPOX class probable F420-dependent enzyme